MTAAARVRCYVAAAAVASVAGALGPRRGAALTKPVPMLILAGQIARTRRRRSLADTVLLAAAAGFSAAGDRAMLVEEFTPDGPGKDRRLAWGAGLFTGAQVAYCALLWRRGARPHPAALLPRTAVLAESAAVLAIHRPRLLPVLGTYGNALAAMSALAADLDRPRLRLGGLAFLASDLTIINRRHLLTNPAARTTAEIWVLATYFAAQGLLIDELT
ncbi:MAG: lysoplasmalogenase family protein [Gordonia sp. (in: high G+C Gram-positive bacteria)]